MAVRRLLVPLTMWPSRHPLALVAIVAAVVVSVIVLVSSDRDLPVHGHVRGFINPPASNDVEMRRHVHHPGELRLGRGARASENENASESGPGSTAALLRILILTFKRSRSLARCLASLNAAVYDGQRAVVEIHIDRTPDGQVHNETLETANAFVFKHGTMQVHVQPRHGGAVGQWLNSWRVPVDSNSSEIAVFVEDDITLSPYFARWLRRVHGKYDSYPAIDGYALQAESMRHAVGAKAGNLQGPPGQCVFLYPVLESWGFSPKVGPWRDFIRWYHKVSADPKFIPDVPGLQPSEWYRDHLKEGRAESTWIMWHIHHAYQNHLNTVYPHLPDEKGLAFNWKEPGEHYFKAAKGLRAKLLETWREEDVHLPEKLIIFDAKGKSQDRNCRQLELSDV